MTTMTVMPRESRELARAGGSDTADVTLPFAVSVVPSTLV
jgi:hypothetical protein